MAATSHNNPTHRNRVLRFIVLALCASACASLQGCADSCAGSVQLVSIAPPQCADPTSCDFLCAQSYAVVQSGAAAAVLPLLPATTCVCGTGFGSVVGSTFSANFTDGSSVFGSSNGTNILVSTSVGCRSVYAVTTGSVMGVQGPPQTASGVVSLVSVSPAACVVPSSCDYRCSIGYLVEQISSAVHVTSLLAPGDCVCDAGSGTASGSSATIEFPDGSVAKAASTGSSISISSTVSGLTCDATYEVVAGNVLGVHSSAAWTRGVIVLQSVTPAECVQNSSCDYLCAEAYMVVQVGSQGQVIPNEIVQCNCAHGIASVFGTTAAVTFSDGSSAQAAAAGNAITISTTPIPGLTCTGTYAVTQGQVLGVKA